MVQTRVAPTPTMRRGANFCNASGTVEQVNHYYPFGGLFGQSTNGDTQRYKYNGKEFDRMHGLDWYDYGARHMDAMRFTTMDPLAEKNDQENRHRDYQRTDTVIIFTW